MDIKSSEVPKQIREYVSDYLSTYSDKKKRLNKYKLYQGKKVRISFPWHDADFTTWQAFKILPNNEAESIGYTIHHSNEPSGEIFKTPRTSEEGVEVPSGYVIICIGTYPKRCEIYTSNDALKIIEENIE